MSEAGGAVVLVTGATGFVGSALVRRLAEEGKEVHALARRGADRSHVHGVARFHDGDLLDPRSVEEAARATVARARELGVRAQLVHGAAVISYRTADAALSRMVNVEGTGVVLDAARTAGIDRVCHVSSVVTVGHAASADDALTEEAEFNGAELRTAYVTTKRAAEDFALAVASQQDVVVVNPGAVFGRTARPSNTQRFLAQMARGRTGPFAPPGSLAVVGVDDVAEGIALALERGRRGRRYLLTESNWTHLELFRLAARLLDARPPRLALPGPLWSAAVAGVALVDRLRPLRLLSPQTLRLLGKHFRFDSTRAREELGWRPRPFTEVLPAVVDQVRERLRAGT